MIRFAPRPHHRFSLTVLVLMGLAFVGYTLLSFRIMGAQLRATALGLYQQERALVAHRAEPHEVELLVSTKQPIVLMSQGPVTLPVDTLAVQAGEQQREWMAKAARLPSFGDVGEGVGMKGGDCVKPGTAYPGHVTQAGRLPVGDDGREREDVKATGEAG